MSRPRQLSPWYWVMLGALVLAAVLFVTNLVSGWAPNWLPLAVMLIVLGSNIFTFRMLWRQSDHPAFHGDQRRSDAKPLASSEDEPGR